MTLGLFYFLFLLYAFWFSNSELLDGVSAIIFPSILELNTVVLYTDSSSISIDKTAEMGEQVALSCLHLIAFKTHRILSLLIECLFKAAHTRPNIFYVNSSWPWSCDTVERYIASKLLLIIIIALTFGNNLHFF